MKFCNTTFCLLITVVVLRDYKAYKYKTYLFMRYAANCIVPRQPPKRRTIAGLEKLILITVCYHSLTNFLLNSCTIINAEVHIAQKRAF